MGGGHPLPYPPPAYFDFALRHAPVYYSTAGETVIIVFSNVVVRQKRLFSIETLAKNCLCAIIGRGSEGGF